MKTGQKFWSATGLLFLIVLTILTIYSYQKQEQSRPSVTIAAPQNTQQGCLIPSEAIYLNANQREYLILVKERNGAWGKEYYCTFQYVLSEPHSDSMSVLQNVDELLDPVVTKCSSSVGDGDAVRIQSETSGKGGNDEVKKQPSLFSSQFCWSACVLPYPLFAVALLRTGG